MDIQFVSEYTYSICNYVTKYITKSEKSNIENLEFASNDESPYRKATKFAYGLLRMRELGAHEAADRILQNSGELWRSSETYLFIPTTFPKYRTRTLKRINELENQSGSSSKLFYSDLVHDYYPNRPHELHSLSLLSFAEQYEKIYYTPKTSPYICIKSEDGKLIGTFKKRSKIPVIYHHKYSVTKDPELFYYSLLILHKPWHNERDIIGHSSTYKEEFFRVLDELPALQEAYTFKEQVRSLRDEVDADVDKIVKNLDKPDDIERECNDNTNEPINLGLKEFEDINSVKCMFDSEKELSSFVSTLNSDQLRIYNTITNRLRHQLDHECGKCSIKNCDANNPLLMYISGYGGTGKSYLVRAILGFINIQRKLHKEKCDYVVAAPTGLAAAGIGGQTIHSVFNIAVQHGKMPKYTSLSASNLDQMRAVMSNLKCIIIDEISMVSNILLLQIHLRLQDAFDKISLFGGKNIILFGDLLQLPPVNSSPPYEEIKGRDVSKITDGIKVSMNLWREFDYEELTINQRQSGDSNDAWRQLLYRARLGILSCNDHCLLSNRLVPLGILAEDTHRPIDEAVEYFLNLKSIEPSAVCLLPTRNMVDEFNSKVMSKLNRSVIEISALDEIDCKIKRISKNAEEAVEQLDRLDDARQTGGLEKVLKLVVGARVMLRKNLDVTKGLVNGSMGTLVDVVYDKQETIQLLKIKFDLYSSVIDIARDTRKIQIYSNAYLYRKQFPLTIAYSMTIHKSQGLSLKCVLADLGKSVFSPGMAYVCLSRVTSLDGLHLLNLSASKIKASKSAIKEYVRLRGKAFNEMSVKIKYNIKDVERVWYTTGAKRKCINSISSQIIHGIPEVKKVKHEHTLNPAYSCELNYIKDLKSYVPHSLLHYVTDVNYDLVYGDCIKTVMFENLTFRDSSELTSIIRELYPDTDNKFNRHNEAQWLSEVTVSSYCTYLKIVTNAKVFSFASYFSTLFDTIGDVSSDHTDILEDPTIPTAFHKFIMQALMCVMSDVHLMQPTELSNMSYSQKIRHIMISNGDPLDHDYILFPINSGSHWYMIFIDNRSSHKKCIYLDSGSSGKRVKRDYDCNKAIKIINYYREYLNLLLQGNNQSINSLEICPLTHPMDYELTSNMQENSHDCGPFTLMNAEILLRNGNINTLLTAVMPLLRIYIMYNLICKLRGIRLRS